jgi:hypothetical protein
MDTEKSHERNRNLCYSTTKGLYLKGAMPVLKNGDRHFAACEIPPCFRIAPEPVPVFNGLPAFLPEKAPNMPFPLYRVPSHVFWPMRRRARLPSSSPPCFENDRATAAMVSVGMLALAVFLANRGAGFAEPSTKQLAVLSGHVLDADNAPVPGATVYPTCDPKLRKKTDAKGRFHFNESETRRVLEKDEERKFVAALDLVAVAEGFGLDWVTIRGVGASGKNDLDARTAENITLRLVKDDVPIRGRMVNGRGEPIANARVELGQILVFPNEDVVAWLRKWEASKGEGWPALANHAQRRYLPVFRRLADLGSEAKVIEHTEPVVTVAVATDEQGRFEIRGVGRDRAVWLQATHPDCVTRIFFAATRARFELKVADPALPSLHSSEFCHALSPRKPVRGVVRERGTMKPLAGATVLVQATPIQSSAVMKEITSADGTFDVRGLGTAERYVCVVISARGQPHLRRQMLVNGTPGLDPMRVDIDLVRGVVVQGRVKNRDSGKPVPRATLTYFPAPGNAHLKDFRASGELGPGWDYRSQTDQEGAFSLAIPPGPGLIGVRCTHHAGKPFRDCTKDDFPYPLAKEEGEYYFKTATDHIIRPGEFHAVMAVNPTIDEPAAALDINLTPNNGK